MVLAKWWNGKSKVEKNGYEVTTTMNCILCFVLEWVELDRFWSHKMWGYGDCYKKKQVHINKTTTPYICCSSIMLISVCNIQLMQEFDWKCEMKRYEFSSETWFTIQFKLCINEIQTKWILNFILFFRSQKDSTHSSDRGTVTYFVTLFFSSWIFKEHPFDSSIPLFFVQLTWHMVFGFETYKNVCNFVEYCIFFIVFIFFSYEGRSGLNWNGPNMNSVNFSKIL